MKSKRGRRFILYWIFGMIVFAWLVKVPILSWMCTERLGFPVLMEWVSIGPRVATVRDFRVHSKEEASSFVFLVEKMDLFYQWKALFASPSSIETLHGDAVKIQFSHLENEPFLKKESILIRKLILTNIQIQEEGENSMYVGRLELRDVPVNEMMFYIFKELGIDADYEK